MDITPLCVVLRNRRSVLGMSQRELERRSGGPQALICRVEAGKEAMFSTDDRLALAMGAVLVTSPRITKPDQEIIAELAADRLAAEDRRRVARRSRPRRTRRA